MAERTGLRSTRLPAGAPIPQKSFDERIRGVYDRLLMFAVRLTPTREEAEDLVQAGILRAWRMDPENPDSDPDHPQHRNVRRYDPTRSSFYTWCRMQILHTWHDHDRHKKERPLSLDYAVESGEEAIRDDSLQSVNAAEIAEENDALQSFMEKLTPVERDIVGELMKGYNIQEASRRVRIQPEVAYQVLKQIRGLYKTLSGRQDLAAEGSPRQPEGLAKLGV